MANDATKVEVTVTGKVYFAPPLTALPTTPSVALDAAFLDVGYLSDEGITGEPEENNTDVRALGGDLVRRVISEYGETYTFGMLEHNANTVTAYYGNGSATAWEGKSIEIRKSWVIHITDGAKIRRIVLPDAAVTDRAAITFATSSPIVYGITLSTYPNATGVHSFGYHT